MRVYVKSEKKTRKIISCHPGRCCRRRHRCRNKDDNSINRVVLVQQAYR